MPIIDDRTTDRNWPKPNAANKLKDDVVRLRAALDNADGDVTVILTELALKAALVHGHAIADITGLQGILDAKSNTSHNHQFGSLSDVSVAGASNGQFVMRQGAQWISVTPLISHVSGLQAALDAKATPADLAAAIADKQPLNSNLTNIALLATTPFGRSLLTIDRLELFSRTDPYSVAFAKTGAATVSIKAGTIVEVADAVYTFAVATAVTMPVHAAGTDYAIWIKPDGTLAATTDFVSPPVANSRKLGGYHYAPGGNATATSGGNTTPAINEYSLWDIKFRPACPDPRGMALVAGGFWSDIYKLGVSHILDGTSKYNVTIADGSSPPKIPLLFGGNGSTAYSTLNWWEAAEVMASHGKRLLTVAEFGAAMYGTTEATSGGTDPVSTILRAASTSKWGMMLSTGNLWDWGDESGAAYGTAAFTANGRGSTYMLSNAVLLGGHWADGADSGSRASLWDNLPSSSAASVGARGRCDQLNHV